MIITPLLSFNPFFVSSLTGLTNSLHECGHALVSLLTPGAMPLDKITIIPRGDVNDLEWFVMNRHLDT